VSKILEARMSFWDVLGVSAREGMMAACAGVVATLAMAGTLLFRSSRIKKKEVGLRLLDR
jgi:hypothetical protein